ncbi:hypothetical protein XH90_31755 [Bradyrhizobium sp. CCBAU 53338]|nr:hypothetical protein XH90_31755 [Bradyrhizobium sp. CCBAU 53338]
MIAASSALALELVRYEPKVVLKAEPIAVPGRSMDVLNVQLGMSYLESRAILEKALPKAEISVPRAAIQLNYKGALIQTPDFANVVSVARKQDETGSWENITLRFSGPASGNQLIALGRILTYGDPIKAPRLADFRAAIFNKYGEPSKLQNVQNNTFSAEWSFVGEKLLSCAGQAWTNCPPFNDEYSAMSLSSYANDKSPHDFLVKVFVSDSPQDHDKVSQLSVYMTSIKRRTAAATADLQSLIEEGARLISLSAAPATPKL